MRETKKEYKVIIWGFGSVGTAALHHILDKKSLKLVAVFDVDPNKVGKDAGTIIGKDEVGVVVSNDREAVLNTEADICLYYAPMICDAGTLPGYETWEFNKKDIIDILSHGKNVTTTVDLFYSEKLQPNYYAEVDKVARENGVTFTQQGVFPGFFTPYLPTILGSLSSKTEQVIISAGENDSYNMAPWADYFCYGKNIEDIPAEYDYIKNLVCNFYGPTTIEISDRLGLEYDEFRTNVETIMSDKDVMTPHGLIKKGTIGVHHFVMATYKDGKEVVGFHFNHKGSDEILKDYKLEQSIEILGDPHIKADIQGVLNYENPFGTSEAPSVNLIPGIVAAEPGYHNALDIALIRVPD